MRPDCAGPMLTHFRDRYPMGSLITDLVRVEEGIFVVKAQIIVNNIVLATGIAGSTTVEEAEDAALQRALNHAGFGSSSFPIGADPKAALTSSSYSSPGSLPRSGVAANGTPAVPSLDPAWSPPPTPVPTPSSGLSAGSPAPAGSQPSLRGSGHEWSSDRSDRTDAAASYSRPPATSMLPDPVVEAEDLSDIIAQSDVELQRIGWGPKEGREFLESRFNKKSRHQLNEAELREFLSHLKQQPTRLRQESPF